MGDITELGKSIKIEYGDFFASEPIENPKVSIIVPAYNVADYIEECLASLVKQTLREIEIIVIDDGSFDFTSEIIHMFKGDARIKVYTQGNSGPSLSRNKGMNLAKGEYIAFVDADDWIDTDFIEKLYNAAKKSDSDIAAATIIRKREKSQKYRVHYTEEKIYKTLEEKIKICDIPTCCYVWNKIYRADFVKKFKFKVGAFFEDVLWIPEVLKQANQLITVADTTYYYRVNKNSIVKKLPSKKKQDDSYKSKRYIISFFEENNLPLSKKARNLSKRTFYFLKLPVLKIKEFEKNQTFYLFGILPIFKLKNSSFNFFNLIKYRNVDAHHVYNLFGLTIRKKHKDYYVDNRIATSYGLNREEREEKIIVSLTTFPERIKKVHIVINQLLTQTVKPDKLILWLAESQFPNKENDLPKNLLKLKDYGLTIAWCEDLRSYKKLIPTLRDCKNEIIITYDDDIYYEKDSIEKLFKAYLKDKKCIHTNRYSRLYFKKGCWKLHKAKKLYFDLNSNKKPDYKNTIIGCGGVLYPPNSLCQEVLNVEKFKSLIPTQDDIWFWAMAVLNQTKINIVDGFTSDLITVEDTQEFGLCKQNSDKTAGMSGQKALEIVLKEYSSLSEMLKN